MTEQEPQYKPGDIANGHILTLEGTWKPLEPAPAEAARHEPQAPWWRGVWLLVLTGFLVGLALGLALAAHEPRTVTVEEVVEKTPGECIAALDSSAEVSMIAAEGAGYAADLMDATENEDFRAAARARDNLEEAGQRLEQLADDDIQRTVAACRDKS
jgi:hypothetical protein